MQHTISMYASKDQMIEAMQAEIDSIESELAELRKDRGRLDFLLTSGCSIQCALIENEPMYALINIGEEWKVDNPKFSKEFIFYKSHRELLDAAIDENEQYERDNAMKEAK